MRRWMVVLAGLIVAGLGVFSGASAQWEPDVRLTYNDSASSTSPNNARCVAASGSNVHVVWADTRVGNFEIYTKRSTDYGSTWGADTRLTNNSAGSVYPSMTVSGSNLHVVWQEYRDGNREIYYKRSTDYGSTWGADTRLTNDSAWSDYPSVAALGIYVHVVWEDYRDGSDPQIYYKRSLNSGASWGADTRLTNDSLQSYHSSVAFSGTNVHVVWEDTRWGDIYYKRSMDYGANWFADTRLTDATSGFPSPTVAASGSNVHVVWKDYRDGNYEIYYKRSTTTGSSWGTDTRLTNNSGVSENPSVAVSLSIVHVVWEDTRAGFDPEIYYKRSTDSGTTWGLDTRLTNNTFRSEEPSVAVSGSNVHVVWEDNRVSNWEIYYKRNPTGNSGIEEGKGFEGPRVQGVKITPNPFTSFATLPGHEAERFSLYDISGRKVGTYRGDRVGEGLAPGVYFLKPEGGDTRPLRIVKVR